MLAWMIESCPIERRLPATWRMRRHATAEPAPVLTAPDRRAVQPSSISIKFRNLRIALKSRQRPLHAEIRPDRSDRLPVPTLCRIQPAYFTHESRLVDQFAENGHLLIQQGARPVRQRPVQPFRHRRIE